MVSTAARFWACATIRDGRPSCSNGANNGNNGANNANNNANNGEARPRNYDLIRGDRFQKLVIEVDAIAGLEPRGPAQAELTSQLEALIDKPGGIEWRDGGGIESRGEDYAWSFSEFRDELAPPAFDLEVPADTIKIHVLYVDGHDQQDTANRNVLGIAWSHTHLVLYKQTIEDACSRAAPLPTVRERFATRRRGPLSSTRWSTCSDWSTMVPR